MKSQEIRERFAQYFMKHNHEKISSSSLIPHNDPTLLFANAGMNQFKDFFTGKAKAKNPRAVTIQKCVRAGGKHNDLDNVGFTPRHHTFFEMLGNFSFGDYFKKDAINFAWTFLTVELKIPKEKLLITVHESDQEAADIWHKEQGVPRDRIFYLGDKDNFWEMGDVGPCGPCSEIFYDHGEKFSDGADTSKCLLHDEGRYIEIWNLVFMQYEKYKDGTEIKTRPLPRPSVDTGAGLERISAALQGVYWNYDSDIFAPILSALEKLSGKKYSDPKVTSSFRVVADHIRSATMLITDGSIPSNEGRGYVLRRIIRRGVRHLEELGITETSFYKLIPAVFESLGQEYPDNASNSALAEKLLKIEEEKFRQTLKTGLELIKKEMKDLSPGAMFSGEAAFKLYDTYGFPMDLTEIILNENNLKLDVTGFDEAMKRQKENSKKAGKFQAQDDNVKAFYSLKEKFGATEFEGYSKTSLDAKLLAIETIDDTSYLVFDKTPFYAESGGQAGDSGFIFITSDKAKKTPIATIDDTQKPVDGLFVHILSAESAQNLEVGETYTLSINTELRALTAKNHSATHLLQSALMKVLGDHVKQAGSTVKPDRLRFDFTQPEAMTIAQIQEVEKLVNDTIFAALPVTASVMSKDEATKLGAMALFGEKYGDVVRVLQMGDFSIELCGGTHVANTSDIGLFTIITEGSLSSGIRRIEATTSVTALEYLQNRSSILQKLERTVSVKNELVLTKVEEFQNEIKEKSKRVAELEAQIQQIKSKDLFNNIEELSNSQKIIIANPKEAKSSDLRNISDNFTDKFSDTTLILYINEGDKVSYLLKTNNKKLNLNLLLKECNPIINGRGGGKPDMAQGSGESAKFNDFITQAKAVIAKI